MILYVNMAKAREWVHEHTRDGKHVNGYWRDAGESTPAAETTLATRAAGMKTPLAPEAIVELLRRGVTKFPSPKVDPSTVRLHLGADPAREAVAEWVDSKGNTQRAYTAEFHARHAEAKWERIGRVGPLLDEARRSIFRALDKATPGSDAHQGATIAAVIAETGLRVGGRDASTAAGHYGVSTLRGSHVTFDSDGANLAFVGKAGKVNHATVTDPDTVAALRGYVRAAGDGPLFTTDATEARDLLPGGMKLKDLRTLVATHTAQEALRNTRPPPPLDPDPDAAKRQIARVWLTVSKQVATRLNNTPAIARAAYIHPEVLNSWVRSIGGGHLAA